MIVRDFQSVIGRECREQCLKILGRLPDKVVACVWWREQRSRDVFFRLSKIVKSNSSVSKPVDEAVISESTPRRFRMERPACYMVVLAMSCKMKTAKHPMFIAFPPAWTTPASARAQLLERYRSSSLHGLSRR